MSCASKASYVFLLCPIPTHDLQSKMTEGYYTTEVGRVTGGFPSATRLANTLRCSGPWLRKLEQRTGGKYVGCHGAKSSAKALLRKGPGP